MNCRIPKLGFLIILTVTNANGCTAVWVIVLTISRHPRSRVSLTDGNVVGGEVRPDVLIAFFSTD